MIEGVTTREKEKNKSISSNRQNKISNELIDHELFYFFSGIYRRFGYPYGHKQFHHVYYKHYVTFNRSINENLCKNIDTARKS